jgi:hypothetical protein
MEDAARHTIFGCVSFGARAREGPAPRGARHRFNGSRSLPAPGRSPSRIWPRGSRTASRPLAAIIFSIDTRFSC